MSDADWPAPEPAAPREPERRAPRLPRVEDLPVAEGGYDREKVREAFDAFYRHAAQLDATLATLEAVEAFQRTSAELRAELRTIRGSGWTVQSWQGAPGYGGRGRAAEWSLPPAFPRVALEALFLIVIGVVVGVAGWSRLTIVLVMGLALAVVWLIEWVAARERAIPHAPAPAAVPALDAEPEVSAPPAPAAWTAQEEGPEALTMLGAAVRVEDAAGEAEQEEAEKEEEAAAVPEAAVPIEDTAEEPGVEEAAPEPEPVLVEEEEASEPEPEPQPLPLEEAPEPEPVPVEEPPPVEELPPIDEPVAEAEPAADVEEAPSELLSADEPPRRRRGLFRRMRAEDEPAQPQEPAVPEPPVVDFELPTEEPLVAAAETIDGETLDGAAELDPWEQPPAVPELPAEPEPAAVPLERPRARRRALRRARRR